MHAEALMFDHVSKTDTLLERNGAECLVPQSSTPEPTTAGLCHDHDPRPTCLCTAVELCQITLVPPLTLFHILDAGATGLYIACNCASSRNHCIIMSMAKLQCD